MNIPERDIYTDIHTHLLPGIDDGSRSTEESLELLAMEYERGIRTVLFTPHYRRTGSSIYAKVAYEHFLCDVKENRPEIFRDTAFGLGQELTWHESLIDRLQSGDALTLSGTNLSLIEFDPGIPYDRMAQELRRLLNAGFLPVIAHMERYEALTSIEPVTELRRMGCRMQVNYKSITGDGMTGREAPFGGIFSKEVKRVRGLIKDGMIDYYGTDTHRMDYRPPKIEKALEWLRKNG